MLIKRKISDITIAEWGLKDQKQQDDALIKKLKIESQGSSWSLKSMNFQRAENNAMAQETKVNEEDDILFDSIQNIVIPFVEPSYKTPITSGQEKGVESLQEGKVRFMSSEGESIFSFNNRSIKSGFTFVNPRKRSGEMYPFLPRRIQQAVVLWNDEEKAKKFAKFKETIHVLKIKVSLIGYKNTSTNFNITLNSTRTIQIYSET